eukprot:scaffold51832_cov57-Attheya_sp.AAC.8
MFAAMVCETCVETDEIDTGLNKANMDESVPPSQNFFLHANGGWMATNPIPAGYPSWNTFLTLHVKSQENLKAILDELEQEGGATENGDDEKAKVTLFYNAAMDVDQIETDGITALQPLLDLCDEAAKNLSNSSELARITGKIHSEYGVNLFFGIGASADNKNSNHSLCQVAQGGLGMPDRDYYFDEDKEEKRTAYKKHVAKMLTLLQTPNESSVSDEDIPKEMLDAAEMVYGLELKLAEAHMTKTENRDPEATYNKMSIADFNEKCGGTFDFPAFFESATGKNMEELGEINVRNEAALKCVAKLLTTEELDVTTLHHYLRWHAVNSTANYLSKAFVDEDFDYYERVLTGTEEIKPRWKRAMAFTESALGEALGQLYCARYFDESCKDRALKIVESVRQALEQRLREVDWMTSDTTREAGLLKMSRFNVKIGYPDKWIDYTPFVISGEDKFLTMVFKSRTFHHFRDVKEMNAPTDRDKWFMNPQNVNAYYHPSLNEIVFPAAILQPPFFNPNADDAVNYGSMGAVVGHEMTHGFDDKGRKFNSEGNMMDWWTEADGKEYDKRVDVMVEQANSFQVHGQSVQGKLTCGENIADLGGLRLAYRALKAQPGFDTAPLIDGYTPTERFFLAWAQCWRQNVTKERALQLLTLDPHGPNEMRCNGPLSNIPEFLEAFDIPSDSPMFRPPESRVDIW